MGIKYIFNPTTGSLDAVSVETPAGADTEIQFNNAGVFGADSDLTWDDTSTPKVLGVGGDINLDDGGTYTTTLQTITATAARTISFPDATGTVGLVGGSSGNLVVNQSGAYAGVANSSVDNATGNITLGSRFISSLNGAASAPPGTFTGTWFTGGTATTTKPQVLIEPTGTTSTAWSTAGTGLGVNAASGFAGRLLDLQINGTSVVSLGASSNINTPATTGGALTIGARNATHINCDPNILATQHIRTVQFVGVSAHLSSNSAISWGNSPTVGTLDLTLVRDAADTLAQRRTTNAQVTRVYDTYTSATDFHRIAIATARATLTNVSGASVTATALIPAGAVVMGVTSKVTTALGTTNSTTGYKIGTAGDDDRWGDITGTAAGTTSDNRDWTAGTIECFPAATDIIVTATGGNFDATGVIYLSVQYMTGQAD
jgi:hypothetical protein